MFLSVIRIICYLFVAIQILSVNINEQTTALFVVFLISRTYQVMNSPIEFCINRSNALPIFYTVYAFLFRLSNEVMKYLW